MTIRRTRWSRITSKAWLSLGLLALGGQSARADYASAVLADQPAGYWRLNDTNDVAVNAGTVGAAWNGTYFGGTRVPANNFPLVDGSIVNGLGTGNTAIQVGGNGDEYVQIPESILSDLSEFTMSAWIAPGARGGNRIGLFGQNDAVEFGFISPNQIQLWTPAGQVLNYVINPQTQMPEDTWVHIAAVANGERIRLFVNGQPTTRGESYGNSSFDFNIGGGGIYDTTGNQFSGRIDEVAVFDKALSEDVLLAQVAAAKTAGGNYQASVISTNPIAYYNFNEPVGSPVVNQMTTNPATDGVYTGLVAKAPGPRETYPGFPAGDMAMEVTAPDEGYVNVDKSLLNGLSEFTLSGWIKPGEITDNRVGLFGQNDSMEFGFINPTTIQMWTPDGGFVNFPLNGEINPDEWVHVAAVGDGQEIRIYVDGELSATGGSPLVGNPIDSYGASASLFNIGGGGIYDVAGNQFTGKIDEVAVWQSALTDQQILAHFLAAKQSALPGDFNLNGALDAGDLDLLASAMVSGNDTGFDLNGDNDATIADRRIWINDLKKSYMGDSNLDGEFNSSDFVRVFTAGKFEADTVATWAEGDWDGDQRFSTSDFVEAFQGGGFEIGPRAAVSAVPEPAGLGLFLAGLLGWFTAGRRRSAR